MALTPMIENMTAESKQNTEPMISDEPPITNWPPNLRRREAARYLRLVHGIPVEAATLAKWFCIHSDGPPAFKCGRVPLYPRDKLDAWAIRRLGPLLHSTSELRST
jgi:hypothetical protein